MADLIPALTTSDLSKLWLLLAPEREAMRREMAERKVKREKPSEGTER